MSHSKIIRVCSRKKKALVFFIKETSWIMGWDVSNSHCSKKKRVWKFNLEKKKKRKEKKLPLWRLFMSHSKITLEFVVEKRKLFKETSWIMRWKAFTIFFFFPKIRNIVSLKNKQNNFFPYSFSFFLSLSVPNSKKMSQRMKGSRVMKQR